MPHATHHDDAHNPPVDLLHNQLAFGGDSMLWGIGTAFIPLATIITALAAGLTSDKSLIGLISPAWYLANVLPQMHAARMVHKRRRSKPILVISTLIGRQSLLLIALWLYFTRAAEPQLTLWLLIGAIMLLMVFDGITGQAWFDMMGRAFSPRMKARVLTMNQVLGSAGGIGAGLLVAQILAAPQLPFPVNYAALFGLSWLFMMLSIVSIAFIRERVSTAEPVHAVAATDMKALLRAGWRNDAAFRRMVWVRLLSGVESLAAAFYVVFARERLGLPEAAIGVFTIAFVVGGLAGILLFGWLASRHGSRQVVNATCILQAVATTIALLLAVSGLAASTLTYTALAIAIAISGAAIRATHIGFLSFVQDNTPERDRAIYVGALSTIGGVASLLPLLGGVVIDLLTRGGNAGLAYSVVFGCAAAATGLGAWLSFRLPRPVTRY
jgi:Na+/melibiose symporter-like transporter